MSDYYPDWETDSSVWGRGSDDRKPLVNQKKPMPSVEVSKKDPVPFKKIKSDDYDDGQIVMTIAGTITSLFPIKKGDTYEYQNGKMKDSSGEEIDISFSKNSQPDTAKGKRVTIRSVKTEQHGWNGIKIEDQSFTPQGKTEPVNKRVLKITATAEIIYEGGSGNAGGSGGGNSGAGNGGGKPGASSNQNQQAHPEPILQDLITLHTRCRSYAEQAYPDVKADPELNKPELNQEFIRSQATASIFIEACKMGLAFDFMERISKPVPKRIPPAPEDPHRWREAVIPKGELEGKTLAEIGEDKLTILFDALQNSETKFAKCVKCAFDETGLAAKRAEAERKQQENDQALNPPAGEEDDIPF